LSAGTFHFLAKHPEIAVGLATTLLPAVLEVGILAVAVLVFRRFLRVIRHFKQAHPPFFANIDWKRVVEETVIALMLLATFGGAIFYVLSTYPEVTPGFATLLPIAIGGSILFATRSDLTARSATKSRSS
jgi:hypothetical protein